MKKINLEENIKQVFQVVFKISQNRINKKMTCDNIKNWDSLNHIKLIMALESKFKISIKPKIGINLLSYLSILKYLKKIKI